MQPAASASDAARASELANAVLQRDDLKAHHGWIKYLTSRANGAASRAKDWARVADWAQRILDEPNVLAQLRGEQEWAYESRADGSGQPFRINIPASYDGARPMPLSIYLHGTGANHLELPQVPQQLTGWSARSDFIEVAVLGRGRGAGYIGLGEADVLDVLDYVSAQFRIDRDRVHLVGPSMGGTGVMLLAARHPDRFASAWVVCGSALDIPVSNLRYVPVYATHSDDDWTQPAEMVRGAVEKLLRLGGAAVWDMGSGFGHRVWKYASANERAREWTFAQVRPRPSAVRELDFTALDGDSARAFWAEVAEWGPAPRPARFRLRAADNRIEAVLHNVLRLRLHLDESPLDTARPVAVALSFAGRRAELQIQPDEAKGPVVIAVEPATGAARLEVASQRPPFRLRTPGGPNQLYNGEPLLIVYGTRGGAPISDALKAAAERASRSANASWDTESPARTPDGVPLRQNLYGALRFAADSSVTDEDIAQNHLVLIGTAEQNTVVERIASRLPLKFSAGRIELSDGTSLPSRGRAARMVHYNPEAPERLIYWVASDDPSAYGESSPLLDDLGLGPTASDLIVTGGADEMLVLTRSFDSRWRWAARGGSPLLELGESTWLAAGELTAEPLRRATRSDFALITARRTPQGARAFSPGSTLLSDVTPYFAPLTTLQLTGRQLLAADQSLSSHEQRDPETIVVLRPRPSSQQLDPERTYSVVLTPEGVYQLPHLTRLPPAKLELTELTVADVLEAAAHPAAPAPARR